MKDPDPAPRPEGETAVFEVMIRGSIEAVWRELTKTDEAQGAIFNAWMHVGGEALAPGVEFQMRTKSGKYTSVVANVIEFAPPHKFVHTMAFTAYGDPPSTITYDLEEIGDEVRLRLTVENMPPGTKSAKSMKQGGTMIVNSLKRIVETGKPSFGIRALYKLFTVMEPVSPKRCRASNWPLSTQ